MFVRKKRNRSGSTSIVVVDKSDGIYREVKSFGVQAQDKIVKVADFGAIPNDGKCDIAAIKRALDYVKTVKAEELVFDVGTYDLFVGDASKNMAIEIVQYIDFIFRGKMD